MSIDPSPRAVEVPHQERSHWHSQCFPTEHRGRVWHGLLCKTLLLPLHSKLTHVPQYLGLHSKWPTTAEPNSPVVLAWLLRRDIKCYYSLQFQSRRFTMSHLRQEFMHL